MKDDTRKSTMMFVDVWFAKEKDTDNKRKYSWYGYYKEPVKRVEDGTWWYNKEEAEEHIDYTEYSYLNPSFDDEKEMNSFLKFFKLDENSEEVQKRRLAIFKQRGTGDICYDVIFISGSYLMLYLQSCPDNSIRVENLMIYKDLKIDSPFRSFENGEKYQIIVR